jgi:DNA uptake protein ComE-like DNA-binding protein
MNLQEVKARPKQKLSARRGVVIVATLLIVVLLSLAAYQYADLMTAEAGVAESAHRAIQTRAFAESGIYYSAALLSNPNNFATLLNGNPYNNQQMFKDIPVKGENDINGRFSIIGPMDPNTSNTTTPTYGVSDESSKINLIAWMNIDPTGQQLLNLLGSGAIPNMTPQIAANIVAWMGGSAGIAAGGAQDGYYMGLTPPYRCKNNVPDSLDELLLVQGVTRDLLYGADVDRNGVQNGNEQAATSSSTPPASGFDRGWSAFLTIYSREQNCDGNGNPYMYINNPDLQQLYNYVSLYVDDELAKFIVMYQQYGPANSSGGSQGLGSTIKTVFGGKSVTISMGNGATSQNGNSSSTVQGTLANYQVQYNKAASNKITSFFQLVNAKVNIQSKDPQTGKTTTTQYTSPISTAAGQRELMPGLFTYCTVSDPASIKEIPARININTAPQEILSGLQYVGSSGASTAGSNGSTSGSASSTGLADTDVLNMIQMRQQATGQQGDIYATPTWLLTEAKISPTVLQALDPYITTRAQVFRVQSVGYFDGGKGPAARIEAIVDTNAGRPRIIAWRNLSDLGKGLYDPSAGNSQNSSNSPTMNSNP